MHIERGQGLNHCIADVATLVDVINLDASNMEEAIDEYQDEMIPRAGDEVKLPVKNATMSVSKLLRIMSAKTRVKFAYYAQPLQHDWDMFMQSPVMAKGVVRGVKPT